MKQYEENICLCTLNRIFGFKPRTGRAILEHFGSAEAVFTEGCGHIREVLPYTEGAERITDHEYEISEKELQRLQADNCTFIGIDDRDYPPLLKECEDAPLGLYIKGESAPGDIFGQERYIAVIGTRDLSPYGREWCERIVSAMASTAESPVIVSGLAIGTDITAQRKALECGLPTIGVMATGIDTIYPSRHWTDAMKISRTAGCALVTDYPPETAPVRVNFLRRNRIIAGICSATILIESRIKGGGMMTARLAFGYGRDVYSLPGRVDDIRSQGCNILIKEGIAETIADMDLLIGSLGLTTDISAPDTDPAERYIGSMPADRIETLSMIISAVKKNRGADIESIAVATGLDYRTVAGCIRLLETDGLISVDLMQRCCIKI